MNKFAFLLSASIILSTNVLAADEPSEGGSMHDKNGPCKADVEQYCHDVKPGGGRIKSCMKEHKDQLSAGCKQALAEKKKEHQSKPESGNGAPNTN